MVTLINVIVPRPSASRDFKKVINLVSSGKNIVLTKVFNYLLFPLCLPKITFKSLHCLQ